MGKEMLGPVEAVVKRTEPLSVLRELGWVTMVPLTRLMLTTAVVPGR